MTQNSFVALTIRMSVKNGRILGIDYGSKRIGLAISDPSRTIAQGLPTLKCKNPPDTINQIKRVITEHQVGEIVVGLPLTLRGTTNETTAKVHRFASQLQSLTGLPVHIWDERLTSLMAENTLKALGKSPSKHRQRIDEIAAMLILQNYLDHKNRP